MIEFIVIVSVIVPSVAIWFLMHLNAKNLQQKLDYAQETAKIRENDKKEAENKLTEYQKKFNDFIVKVKTEMNDKVTELESKYKKQSDDRVQKVINDYEEALKLETEGLERQVSELDEQLGIKLQEITGKNTMYFTCTCDRSKQIPCSVDLSSEDNYFTCPECGAVYRIVINASTILQSGITNNPKIANMYDGKEIGEVDRTML